MGISAVSAGGYSQSQAVPGQGASPTQEEQKALADALKEQEDDQKTLVDMMQEAREKAEAAAKKREDRKSTRLNSSHIH